MDQLHPLTAELVSRLGKIAQLPQDFEAKLKMKAWLQILSGMRATEVLTEDQARSPPPLPLSPVLTGHVSSLLPF